MELFEIAKAMELEGKHLYEQQAKKTQQPGLKNILLLLAQQEQDHYNIFDALQKQKPIKLKQESFKGIKDFFKELRENIPQDDLIIYNKVLEIEKETQKFYEELAEKQTDEEAKEIIQKIAKEEHKHWVIIKNLIDYIKKPDQWVEDPEFNHLEDY